MLIAEKGVDVAQAGSEERDAYDLVRRSDGATACSLKLKSGDRVLLSVDALEVGHKHLQMDERITSRETLIEMVRELTANN